jgi:predicted O-linked N-acetylglucosamine transferase (SPINDLY family)
MKVGLKRMTDANVDRDFQLAVEQHRSGRLSEAEAAYRQILSRNPNHVESLYLLGLLAVQLGRLDTAVELFRQTVRLKPDYAEAHYNLGIALQTNGQLDQAIASYRQAIRLRPDYALAHSNLANALMDLGQLDEAIALCRQAIRLKPDLAEAHYNAALALQHMGQLDEAIASHWQAIRLKPDYAHAHYNLANALSAKGQVDEAVAAYRQAILFKPDFAEAHLNLGNALKDMGQVDQAIASYRQAVRLKPGFAEAHSNLGNALKDKELIGEAIAAYRQAIRLKPDYIDAHNNLGNVLKDMGQLDQAIASYRQAIRLKPDSAKAHSNLLFTLQYHPGYDGKMIHEELRRWSRQHAEPLRKFIQPHPNDRNPDRRLRIGYLSPDFRDHPVGQNLLPLLRRHDHRQMEIFCYSNVVRPDALTGQFQRYADAWRNIMGLSDLQTVDLIRHDRIDILVDLTLHTAKNRLVVFAHKPAPVQATFAGYPGSTGLDTIDYRLTDPYLDPPGLNDHLYSETSIRLPDSFWCYDPPVTELAVTSLPAQTNGYVTFGCLNNFCKVNEPVLQLWAQVLKTIPRSRFMMLCPEGSHRQPLLDLLQREEISPDRIELVAGRPRLQYLEFYHRIDVGLDTFPYNGHTTSLDSFWMGVPVVTLLGQTVVGRAGLSQLTNLGLPELIAKTPQQYVQIAADLAGDLPRLAELRRTLRARMQASPLMDAPRFARNVEAAYRQMWRNWCQQGANSSLQCPAP